MTTAPDGSLFVKLFNDRHGRLHRVPQDTVRQPLWKTKCGRYGHNPVLLSATVDAEADDLRLCRTCWPCDVTA